MKYACPVCGFSDLDYPPEDYNICPCCGTEFGYDDFSASHQSLRALWLARGAPWFSRRIAPPDNWSPVQQLIDAGFFRADLDLPAPQQEVTRYSIRRVTRVGMFDQQPTGKVLTTMQVTPTHSRTVRVW